MPQNNWLLAIYCLSLVLYFPLNKRKSKYYLQIPLDNKIPLIRPFLFFYVLMYPYMFFSFLALYSTPVFNQFLLAIFAAQVTMVTIWFIYPNGVKRPVITGTNFWDKSLRYLYDHDNDTNGFPSGHVVHTLIPTYFLVITFPQYALFFWTLEFLIAVSILFTKQHYLLDLVLTLIFCIPFVMLVI